MHATPLAAGAVLLQFVSPQPQPAATEPPPGPKPTLSTLTAIDASRKESVEPVLLEIAREYKTYTRVSDRASWAPELCIVPPPDGVLRSASTDLTTHGRKLYFLFARNERDYEQIGWSIFDDDDKPFTAAVGQVIVKESFKPVIVDPATVPSPEPVRDDDPNKGLRRQRRMPEEYVHDSNGAICRTGAPAGLFIMAKVAETERPGTDRGWIYATISADHASVTAFGRIESCMECHVKTDHDRLFGPIWLQQREARAKAAPKADQGAEPKPVPDPAPGKR